MIQVGFGSGDITPEVGMNMPGGFYKNPGQGVLAPLLASACVVHDGTAWAALVGVDALGITRDVVERARAAIAEKTKVPGANVLIGANHSHSGGPAVPGLDFDVDPKYADMLVSGIVSAVVGATNSLHGAEVGVGRGEEPTIAFNRRFLMRDGREITHPGKPGTPHHEEIARAAGPTDPAVGVMAFRAPGNGPILGLVVNFACHSTIVGGNRFHPDYAGFLRQYLKARYGEGVGVVFLLGACGDLTQVDNTAPGSEFGVDYCNLVGQKLAAEAARTILRMEWEPVATIAVASERVPLTVRPEPDVAREKPPYGLGSSWDEQFAKGRAKVAAIREKTPTVPVEVQAVRIGKLGIVTNPSEFFCDLGLRIKDASTLYPTWVVSLANDAIGYVPTAEAMLAGGYECRTTISSMWAIDAGQLLVEASLRALNKVHPEE